VLPLDLKENVLTVAMSDPSDTDTLESLRMFTGYSCRVLLGQEGDIAEVLERFYGNGGSVAKVSGETSDALGEYADSGEDIEHLRVMASEVPVIRLVNNLVSRAVERRASDIHIEPFEKEFRVRYRIDGILQTVDASVNLAAIVSASS
jgi:general secretion pathway protein E